MIKYIIFISLFLLNLNVYSQVKTSDYGFSIDYPKDFHVSTDTSLISGMKNKGIISNADFIMKIEINDSSYYKNTNLYEAYILASVKKNSVNCTEPWFESGNSKRTKKINGIMFSNNYAYDGGAGNIYFTEGYFTSNKNNCYKIVLYTHSGQVGNFDPADNIREFDMKAIGKLFKKIVSTFKLE